MSSGAPAGHPSMTPKTSLDERFSDPGAEAVAWPATQQVLENAELFWVTCCVAGHATASAPGSLKRSSSEVFGVIEG